MGESVKINEKNMLECGKSEDTPFENFVKVTEDHRRERQRRMDAGDETAQLKFTRPGPPQAKQQQQQTGKGPQAPNHPPRRPPVQGGAGYNTYGSSYGAQKRPYSSNPNQCPQAKAPRSYGGNYG